MNKYVIILKKGNKSEFYTLDRENGNLPYWTNSLNDAYFFNTFTEAEQILTNSVEFTKESIMSNGTIYPPRLLQDACELNNCKIQGTCTITIGKITIEDLTEIEYSVEIKKPVGFKYE